jgi:N-acetyl sugar amidotransferase
MEKIRREEIAKDLYVKGKGPFSAKFGLPPEVKFCKRCVISNQRPSSEMEFSHTIKTRKKTINIDKDGICDACHYAEQKKKTIDWQERDKELKELCDKHRSKDGAYDCIVPGSGGKDSFFASHVLKYKYGMNPLTITWAPNMYTEWGWRNMQGWINAGFDNYLVTPNGRTHRLLTRLAVDNLFHPFQPFIFGQKYLAPKIARMHNVSLVFYGESEAEYGNPIAETSAAQRDWSYFTTKDPGNIYLGGVSIVDLKKSFGLNENDLHQYIPMNPEIMVKHNLEVHYVGYYLPWHPQGNYYYSVKHGNFETSPERMPGTYSKYCSVDDKMEDFNYYTTGIKYGIGWTSYVASHEIRSGDLTREEGVALVKKYDLEFPKRFSEDFYSYISINQKEFPVASQMFEQPIVDHDYFMNLHDKFRSPHLWEYDKGEWRLRHTVWGEAGKVSVGSDAQEAHRWKGNPLKE